MREIQAPEPLIGRPALFLAGSIEMGAAGRWQDEVKELLKGEDIVILNPRRNAWDSSWKQTKDDGRFREQVRWELRAQEYADRIFMYFDPATKSPISLLELGLFGRKGKMIVCCPEGFWRKGNVDIVCAEYGIPEIAGLHDLRDFLARTGFFFGNTELAP